MSLTKEYANQNQWRNWEHYLNKIPIKKDDTVIDLGCSLGFVSTLLAAKAEQVIGVDMDEQLINKAKTVHSAPNIEYKIGNLNEIDQLSLPMVNGIWSSFTAAYFTNFSKTLDQWLALLKPGGWIALVEIDNFFGHTPLSETAQEQFRKYYQFQLKNELYDFEMGSKLKNILQNKNLQIVHETSIEDKELSFNGPAEPQIIEAWKTRLGRMKPLQSFLGENFQKVKTEFLSCLLSAEHQSICEVKFIVARK